MFIALITFSKTITKYFWKFLKIIQLQFAVIGIPRITKGVQKEILTLETFPHDVLNVMFKYLHLYAFTIGCFSICLPM